MASAILRQVKLLNREAIPMESSRLMQSMLFDFYGDLLTEKQRECYSLYYNDDLSLSEIAEERGISRQGVWDNIRHAESAMKSIEEKTGLIARFEKTRSELAAIREMVSQLQPAGNVSKIKEKIDGLMDSL